MIKTTSFNTFGTLGIRPRFWSGVENYGIEPPPNIRKLFAKLSNQNNSGNINELIKHGLNFEYLNFSIEFQTVKFICWNLENLDFWCLNWQKVKITKLDPPPKTRISPNLGKIKCFTHFIWLEFYFKLESGVNIEINPVERDQNVDFSLKMALNTVKMVKTGNNSKSAPEARKSGCAIL